MAKAIVMPQVGQDIETAIITEWLVKENDKVKKGDIIAVVDSDKASFEVEVFESGTILKLLYKEKEEAHVLEPIAYIGKPGEDFDSDDNVDDKRIAKKIEISEHSKEKKEKLSVYKQQSRIFATPAAKRVANINNIDLSVVMGTGPGGRIVKNDVLAQVENEEVAQEKGSTMVKLSQKCAGKLPNVWSGVSKLSHIFICLLKSI